MIGLQKPTMQILYLSNMKYTIIIGNAILWFLEELDVKGYEDYLKKYPGSSSERSYFIAVCSFFELSGVLMDYDLIDQNLYFDINPTPFWDKAKTIVERMRNKRPHIYEKFELLSKERLNWTKKRNYRSKLLIEGK